MLSGLLGRALLVGADGDFAAILGPSGEIDSLLVVASSAVTRDVYQQTMHPDLAGETLTGLSRRVTLVLALVALAGTAVASDDNGALDLGLAVAPNPVAHRARVSFGRYFGVTAPGAGFRVAPRT